MRRLLILALCAAFPCAARAEDPTAAPTVHLSRFAAGAGPRQEGDVGALFRLLDDARTPGQSNAVAVDPTHEGARRSVSLVCKLKVLEGGDGGAFLFLNTEEYGARGPAPFLKSWVEPNLRKSFAVGIDVHDPPSQEMFTPWGNYQDLPQREVSLHWDGREIVKRVAPREFRGEFADVAISLDHVVGGAEVTVKIAGAAVYDRYFVAGLDPYPLRLAIGAGTRADATTGFDIKLIGLHVGMPAPRPRPPLHFELFNHVLTDNARTAYTTEVVLPPVDWAFGRVVLTLDIHDAGKDWDEWDRNGEVSVYDGDRRLGILPFITSYRTECHWEVDVTHFRPLLSGKRTFEIHAGTTFYKNRGYMMSAALDFHHADAHADADMVPYRVVPLWHGTAHYRSDENHFRDFFTPQTVAIDAEAEGARIVTTTTGHSQVGEFTPSKRTLVFRPMAGGTAEDEQRFENTLWKTDCYLNPNRPQFGTWQYSRAGWAPGDVVRPWIVDLAGLQPGKTAELRYEPAPYAFDPQGERPGAGQIAEANHVVRSYLVLYRHHVGIRAPALLVTDVAKGSNAEKAGLRAGDYLASYNGTQLDGLDDLRAAIQAAAGADGKLAVVAYRGAERLVLELAPGKMGVGLATR